MGERSGALGEVQATSAKQEANLDSLDMLRLGRSCYFGLGTRNPMNNDSRMCALTLGVPSWDGSTGGIRSTYMASCGNLAKGKHTASVGQLASTCRGPKHVETVSRSLSLPRVAP